MSEVLRLYMQILNDYAEATREKFAYIIEAPDYIRRMK